MAILGRNAVRHVATKTVGSAIDRCDAGLAWYAQGEVVGGGIFALRRPRPYSRHLRGFRCDTSPPTTICDHMGINGNGEWEGNDAARRIVIKTADLHGWKARRAWYPHGGDKGRRLSIRISVGEVPSVASALPNQRGMKARSRRGAPRRYVLWEMGE